MLVYSIVPFSDRPEGGVFDDIGVNARPSGPPLKRGIE